MAEDMTHPHEGLQERALREGMRECPFCQSTDIYIEPDEVGSGGQWVSPVYVGCNVQTGCGFARAFGDDKAEAEVKRLREALSTLPQQAATNEGEALEQVKVRPVTIIASDMVEDWVRRAMRFIDLCDADAGGYDDLHDDAEILTNSGYYLFGIYAAELCKASLQSIERLPILAFPRPSTPTAQQAPERDPVDMEAVGNSLMDAIEKDYADHPFMKNWHPVDCPTEIVGDLLNALEEATAQQATDADVMIGQFIAKYDEGAAGCMMDADDAQALAREFKRMQGLIYCPGVLRCAKCDFRLIKTTLTPAGAFANNEPDTCPNCNVPMWRVTWQDEAHDAYKTAESQVARALEAEKALSAQQATDRAGLLDAMRAIRAMAQGYAGQPNFFGDIFKIADGAIARSEGMK